MEQAPFPLSGESTPPHWRDQDDKNKPNVSFPRDSSATLGMTGKNPAAGKKKRNENDHSFKTEEYAINKENTIKTIIYKIKRASLGKSKKANAEKTHGRERTVKNERKTNDGSKKQ